MCIRPCWQTSGSISCCSILTMIWPILREARDVLISVMLCGATPPRVARLSPLMGVSRRTIVRWREWWRTTFAESRFWQAKGAVLMPPVDRQRLPASLLERFAGGGGEQLLALLRLLAPISGGVVGHAW